MYIRKMDVKIDQESFKDIKDEILNGRLTMSNIRFYIIGILLYSGFMVGLSFAVANANTVGWENLSIGWHKIYYMEAVLFSLHIVILLLCFAKNNLNQKILMVGLVILTYKAALDPFLTMTMFFKDRGVDDIYMPLTLLLLIIGLIIHIIALYKWIRDLKVKNTKKHLAKRNNSKSLVWISVLFLLVTIVSIVVKNGLLGDYELLFGVFLFFGLYIAFLIGVCEFVIAAYCVLRFPSFSVNPPLVQNYTNKKRRKKKKR